MLASDADHMRVDSPTSVGTAVHEPVEPAEGTLVLPPTPAVKGDPTIAAPGARVAPPVPLAAGVGRGSDVTSVGDLADQLTRKLNVTGNYERTTSS